MNTIVELPEPPEKSSLNNLYIRACLHTLKHAVFGLLVGFLHVIQSDIGPPILLVQGMYPH